jgi:hypothetical protein
VGIPIKKDIIPIPVQEIIKVKRKYADIALFLAIVFISRHVDKKVRRLRPLIRILSADSDSAEDWASTSLFPVNENEITIFFI